MFVLPLLPTSFDAKNASTTTIRMGKAALLKKRLMYQASLLVAAGQAVATLRRKGQA
jgi:hypothetical protein